jgi:hypothetical protein
MFQMNPNYLMFLKNLSYLMFQNYHSNHLYLMSQKFLNFH